MTERRATPATPGAVGDAPAGAPGRYERQALFAPLGAAGDARLRASSAVIIGCGALGSHVADHLARAGVGRLRLVDRDVLEESNLHRQTGYVEADLGRPKAAALAQRLAAANGSVSIEAAVADFDAGNALDLVEGAAIIVDGTDNAPARFLINDAALETGTPWVYGGAVGEEARAQLFVPGSGPCLRCLVPEPPPPASLPTCDTSGILGPAAAAAASFQAALALRWLARGAADAGTLPGLLVRLKLWSPAASVHGPLAAAADCPACARGRRDFLRGGRTEDARALCGRSAVQVRPSTPPAETGALDALAARLGPLGEVALDPLVLRFQPRGASCRLSIFPDLRAIVHGTSDTALARSLYDRYIGQ